MMLLSLRKSALAIIFIFCLLLVSVASDRSEWEKFDRERIKSTREEILAGRKNRVQQLEGMLTEAKQQLQNHQSGKKLLDEADLQSLQRKIDVFSRKLDTMQGELDEREVQRILRKEEIRDQRLKERLLQREREREARHRARGQEL